MFYPFFFLFFFFFCEKKKKKVQCVYEHSLILRYLGQKKTKQTKDLKKKQRCKQATVYSNENESTF